MRLFISLLAVVRASALPMMKDSHVHRQHSPLTALEWDSYPFSDGDWAPCTRYANPPLCVFTLFIQA